MRPAIQKALGWIGLAFGGGGTLVIVWSFIVWGWPESTENRIIWSWFVAMAFLAFASLWLLKQAYGRDPESRRFQMALADLVSALLILGSVLYIGSLAEEGLALLQYWGLPALIFAGSYLVGVTWAARQKMRGWRRYAVGTAWALMIIGCLGVGALVLHLAVLISLGNIDRCQGLMRQVLGVEVGSFHNWLIYTHRVSLCALPLGLLLGLVLRLIMRVACGATNGAGSSGVKGGS